MPDKEKEAIKSYYHSAIDYVADPSSILHLLVGYVNDEPVATSKVFCSLDIASIFDVIVHPKMRRQGLGSQMTLLAMEKAKDDGYNICALIATNDAKHLYKKIGYQSVKFMGVYS